MNLHAMVSGHVAVVNPPRPLNVRVSTGNTENAEGIPVPSYATPGAFVGSISGDVLTVLTQSAGTIQLGQQLVTSGIIAGTRVTEYLTGTGGPGTYRVTNDQELPGSNPFAAELIVPGQIQPVGWRDIQMMDGLNLQGTRNKIWFYGRFDGLIRVDNKGGDLVIDPEGKIYLVAMVAEQWGLNEWCSVYATLQNEKAV